MCTRHCLANTCGLCRICFDSLCFLTSWRHCTCIFIYAGLADVCAASAYVIYLIEQAVCNSHLLCSGFGFELIAPMFDGGDLCQLYCKSKPLKIFIPPPLPFFDATFLNHCPIWLQLLLGFSKYIASLDNRRFHVLKVWALLHCKFYTIAMNIFVGSLAYVKKGALFPRLQWGT